MKKTLKRQIPFLNGCETPGYVTVITVGIREAAAVGIYDMYRWHQALWELFSQNGHRDENGNLIREFIFRVHPSRTHYKIHVLSTIEPVQEGRLMEASGIEFKTTVLDTDFFEAETYLFNVMANPTVTKAVTQKKVKRIGLLSPQDQVSWLLRQGERCGFAVEAVKIPDSGLVKFQKNQKSTESSYAIVTYEGRLRVTNRDAFIEAAFEGIGKGKAFGLGMICLRPIVSKSN